MTRSLNPTQRLLAVAPSTRGFGYAVLEGDTLVDWGVKPARGDKNAHCLKEVATLLALYAPAFLVLEHHAAPDVRRAARIQTLGTDLAALAASRTVKVKRLTRTQVRKAFFADREGTKHELATLLAEKFPKELKHRLPRKRRPWMSEAYAMGIFDAVALGLAVYRKKSHEI